LGRRPQESGICAITNPFLRSTRSSWRNIPITLIELDFGE
jgi:hypothetical protein